MSDVTLHVNTTFLRVEDRLLSKKLETKKAKLLKNDCRLSSKTVEMAYAV